MSKYFRSFLSLALAAWLTVFTGINALALEASTNYANPVAASQQASISAENPLKIAFVDAGRKYFSKESLKKFIDSAAQGNFNAVEIGFGNDGLRFLLDDMSITVGDKTYASQDVKDAILKGNVAYYDDPNGNALLESEMDEIIAYANSKGIQIIPLLNTPGHMNTIVYLIEAMGFTNVTYDPTKKYPSPTEEYPYDKFVPSKKTINLDNQEVVAFTKALVQKYINYFQSMGSDYFNMGADEFANDIQNEMGIHVLARDPKDYAKLVTYINDLAAMIKKADMRPMAFNDCMYYNNNKDVSFDKDIIVSYWSNGWWHYYLATPQTFVEQGHELINLNGAYYWILGEDKDKCSPEKAAQFNINEFATEKDGQPDPKSVVGAMFAIWSDEPQELTDVQAIEQAAATVKAFGGALVGTENPPIETPNKPQSGNDASKPGEPSAENHVTTTPDGIVQEITKSDGKITNISITIPQQAVDNATESNGLTSLSLAVDATKDKNTAVPIQIDVPDNGAKIEIPVNNLTAGVVAIIIQKDGTEQLVKRSGLSEKGVILELKADSVLKLVDNSPSFQDVSAQDWYKNAVDFVSAHELMQGTSAASFSPEQPLSRGMLAVILYNLENQPAVSKNTQFSDAPADQWYTDAIVWAAEKGILFGYGDGRVGPNDSITREQLVTMLHRYAGKPSTNYQLDQFSDAHLVNDFAKNAMAWAVENKLLREQNNTLAPNKQATRAEVAQMLLNLLSEKAYPKL